MVAVRCVPPDGCIVYEGGLFRITVYDINEFGQRVISFRVNQTPEEFFYWKKLRDAAEAQYQRAQAESAIAVLPKGRLRKRAAG